MERRVRHRQPKGAATDGLLLHTTAPVPDPTDNNTPGRATTLRGSADADHSFDFVYHHVDAWSQPTSSIPEGTKSLFADSIRRLPDGKALRRLSAGRSSVSPFWGLAQETLKLAQDIALCDEHGDIATSFEYLDRLLGDSDLFL